MVALMRICSPNFWYWPYTTVSALVNSAMRFSVDKSSCDCGEICRSRKTCCKRLGETSRTRLDWPISVPRVSETLDANQFTLGSLDEL